jgi:hypothetical protein
VDDAVPVEIKGDGDSASGPLSSLYDNRYKDIFLQYPLNLESAEENHWVRFDIKELIGAQIKEDSVRTVSAGFGAFGKGSGSGGGSFLDRIITNTAEKASALVTTALMAPVNIAKSTVNQFLNELPPILGGIGRELIGGISGSTKGRSRGLGSVMLFAPHTRQENLKFNWKNENVGQTGALLGGGGGTVAGAAMAAWSGRDPEGTDASGETIRSMIANKGTLGQAFLSQYAGAQFGADGKVMKDVTTKSRGQAINPHLEMFFDAVDFRTFTFDFRLAPRNSQEARAIHEIINLFKYASAPAYGHGSGGVFFHYPNVFEVSLFNENETHKIATSALTQVSVDHSAAGVNSTFYDNYPVETNLNLTFTELEIMHKTKIDKGY